MDTTSKAVEEISNLKRKADQTRSIFNAMRNRVAVINKVVVFFVTIGSAIAAMLIFSSCASEHPVIVGLLSACIFLVSLIPSAGDLNTLVSERTAAVRSWGGWIRDADNFLNLDIVQLDEDQIIHRQRELVAAYKKIMDDTPVVPDTCFLKYKRLHRQKVEISKELDKKPFKTIKQIKRELRSVEAVK